MLEVVDANTPKGPIDVFLDGFVIAEMPKGPAQVYKLKGTCNCNMSVQSPLTIACLCSR